MPIFYTLQEGGKEGHEKKKEKRGRRGVRKEGIGDRREEVSEEGGVQALRR
jgi:hypothetical protein